MVSQNTGETNSFFSGQLSNLKISLNVFLKIRKFLLPLNLRKVIIRKMRMKFTVSHKEKSKFEAGLRGFFQYRDLGIDTATKGNYGANVIRAVPGKHSKGEWHLHK